MKGANSSSNNVKKRFWDNYIKFIQDKGVKDTVVRWYVIRIEQYIKAFPEKRLAEHGPQDIVNYLEKQGRLGKLKDWQFRQIVDAIRNLFAMLNVAWLSEVDWKYWMDSASSLPEAHSTIAREVPAEETIEKLANLKSSKLTKVRRLHKEVLKQLLIEVRRRGYSIKTEQTYESWVARFIAFNNNQDPRKLSGSDVVSFLQHLVVRRNVSASTQNQALNALVFFYDHVLKLSLGELGDFVRAKRPKKLPVVLTRSEIARLLDNMEGKQKLMASLIYGTGMRLMDCVRLRAKDVDFGYRQIVIREGKGRKDRIVPLPERLITDLKEHLEEVRILHQKDLDQGFGEVHLPGALDRKYPNAPKEWGWQYVFPSGRLSVDPRSGKTRR